MERDAQQGLVVRQWRFRAPSTAGSKSHPIPIPMSHSPGLPACPAAGGEQGRPRRLRDGGEGGGRRREEARGSDPVGRTGPSPSSSSRVQAVGMALGVDGGERGVVVHMPGAGQRITT